MGDWSQQNQDFNRITVWTGSPESCGAELATYATTPASAAWPAANTAIFVPFTVYQPLIAVKMFCLNGGTASGNIDIGIYDDQQNRLVSMGSTAQAGTSTIQSFDIADTTLLPGAYYMAMNESGTTGTNISWALSALVGGSMGLLQQAVGAIALPATAAFATLANAYVPNIGFTARTVV